VQQLNKSCECGLPRLGKARLKGLLADRSGDRAAASGDIRQLGGNGVPVGIADPFAPQENAPLLATVWLRDQGMATSGNYRRGFRMGERWRSHLLDPRTGYPVENVVSASVIASSAQLADVLTTAFSVLPPDESRRLADHLPGVGLLLVTRDGERYANGVWRQAKLSTGS